MMHPREPDRILSARFDGRGRTGCPLTILYSRTANASILFPSFSPTSAMAAPHPPPSSVGFTNRAMGAHGQIRRWTYLGPDECFHLFVLLAPLAFLFFSPRREGQVQPPTDSPVPPPASAFVLGVNRGSGKDSLSFIPSATLIPCTVPRA